jgi:lipopolysaccharide/colanic/teichoic acid biosynthesis glycosyltransferase
MISSRDGHTRIGGASPAADRMTGPRGSCLSRVCERSMDLLLGSLLLIATAPLILALLILVKLTSRGSATYRQVRLGLGGREFVIYKIRTMVHNYEGLAGGPRWTAIDNPGITPMGRFLRRTHLDELPQLWNVVRGDMSLVGPRPERPVFVAQLERAIPRYRARLALRPGMTGLAQVYLPPDTTLADVQLKLVYDLYYARNRGPWLDLRLIVCSALYFMGVPFHVSCRGLRIPARATIEGFDPVPSEAAELDARMQAEPA